MTLVNDFLNFDFISLKLSLLSTSFYDIHAEVHQKFSRDGQSKWHSKYVYNSIELAQAMTWGKNSGSYICRGWISGYTHHDY